MFIVLMVMGESLLSIAASQSHSKIVHILINDLRTDIDFKIPMNECTTKDTENEIQINTPLIVAVTANPVRFMTDGSPVTLLSSDTLDTFMEFIQVGIGLNNVHEWFKFGMICARRRIELYQHAVHINRQKCGWKTLMIFKLCLLNAAHNSIGDQESSLCVFHQRYPPLIDKKIEKVI